MVLVDSIVSPSLYWGVRTHTDHRVGALLAILGPMKEFEVGPPYRTKHILSGSSPDSLVCLVPVQCFFVCFVSQHIALSLFVFAMCSSCPTSLFPLVTPPCFVLVLSSFAWWCSPEPRVLCCFIRCSFPLCLCWFVLVFLVLNLSLLLR